MGYMNSKDTEQWEDSEHHCLIWFQMLGLRLWQIFSMILDTKIRDLLIFLENVISFLI